MSLFIAFILCFCSICQLQYSTKSLSIKRSSFSECGCSLEPKNKTLSCQLTSSSLITKPAHTFVECWKTDSLGIIGKYGRPLEVNNIDSNSLASFSKMINLQWALEGSGFNKSNPSPLKELAQLENLMIYTPQKAFDGCVFPQLNKLRVLVMHGQSVFPSSISLPPSIQKVQLTSSSNQQISCIRCQQYPHLKIIRIEEGPPIEGTKLNLNADEDCYEDVCSIDELCGLDQQEPTSTLSTTISTSSSQPSTLLTTQSKTLTTTRLSSENIRLSSILPSTPQLIPPHTTPSQQSAVNGSVSRNTESTSSSVSESIKYVIDKTSTHATSTPSQIITTNILRSSTDYSYSTVPVPISTPSKETSIFTHQPLLSSLSQNVRTDSTSMSSSESPKRPLSSQRMKKDSTSMSSSELPKRPLSSQRMKKDSTSQFATSTQRTDTFHTTSSSMTTLEVRRDSSSHSTSTFQIMIDRGRPHSSFVSQKHTKETSIPSNWKVSTAQTIDDGSSSRPNPNCMKSVEKSQETCFTWKVISIISIITAAIFISTTIIFIAVSLSLKRRTQKRNFNGKSPIYNSENGESLDNHEKVPLTKVGSSVA